MLSKGINFNLMWLKCERPWIHSCSPWWYVVQYPVDVAVFPLIYSILLHPLEFSVSLPGHNLEAVDKAVTMLVVVWNQYVLPGEVWSLLLSIKIINVHMLLTQQFNLQKLCPIFSHSIYEWKITLAPIVCYLFIYFWPCWVACGILVLLPGNPTCTPCSGSMEP